MVAAIAAAISLNAQEPPEAINIHRRDGTVKSLSFTGFSGLELNGNSITVTGRDTPLSLALGDISKITFGDRITTEYPVTFAVVGSGNGIISATAWDGFMLRDIYSGELLPAGSEITLLATPGVGNTVKEWRIDGSPYDGTENELHLTIQDAPLDVTVEFGIGNGSGHTAAPVTDDINVYVHRHESIVIESTGGILHFTLMDMGGRIVRDVHTRHLPRQTVIPVAGMPQGTYILRIRSAESVKTEKVII